MKFYLVHQRVTLSQDRNLSASLLVVERGVFFFQELMHYQQTSDIQKPRRSCLRSDTDTSR